MLIGTGEIYFFFSNLLPVGGRLFLFFEEKINKCPQTYADKIKEKKNHLNKNTISSICNTF